MAGVRHQANRFTQMTTLNPAEFLGRTGTMGSIEVGKNADIVLLDGNPVKSLQNLHNISGVVRAGSFDPRAQRMRKQFIVVLVLEFTAIAVLSMIAYVIHRPYLAPVLAVTVVGLHFLPSARFFVRPVIIFRELR
jgi:hypothetical protein